MAEMSAQTPEGKPKSAGPMATSIFIGAVTCGALGLLAYGDISQAYRLMLLATAAFGSLAQVAVAVWFTWHANAFFLRSMKRDGVSNKKIKHLKQHAHELGKGLLKIKKDLDAYTESIRQKSTELSNAVAQNNRHASTITESIKGVIGENHSVFTELSQMTDIFKTTALDVEELSKNAEETATAMTEMSMSISQVEQNAQDTSSKSSSVIEASEKGAIALSRLVDSINSMSNSSKQTAAMMSVLVEKIQSIEKLAELIEDISENINLLALNAQIIAAQAQEFGKPFAVVAQQMKDLAEKSKSSTTEIFMIVSSVKAQAQAVTATVTLTARDVETGVELGGNTAASLNEIITKMQSSKYMVSSIASAMKEQTEASNHINGSTSRIANSVQSIAYATQNQFRTLESVSRGIHQLEATINGLVGKAQAQDDEKNNLAIEIMQSAERISRSIEEASKIVNRDTAAPRSQEN